MTILSCTRRLHKYCKSAITAPTPSEAHEHTHKYKNTLCALADLVGEKAARRISKAISAEAWNKTFGRI